VAESYVKPMKKVRNEFKRENTARAAAANLVAINENMSVSATVINQWLKK